MTQLSTYKIYNVASFWDEDEAWAWAWGLAEDYKINTNDIVEVKVGQLGNGSYRTSVCLIQAQGELFE